MVQDCYDTTADPACQQAALDAIDAARADEGVGPLLLPDNYDALSPPEQLLVVVDLERVDRGLVPVDGLDPTLDSYAQYGADTGRDPVGPARYTWYSTWAGGEPDALTTDYDWLYDDGPASPNIACPPDCWGHRNAVLSPLGDPSMGAGWSGSDWTMLIVDDWPASDTFSWVSELSDLRPRIPAEVSVSAGPGSSSDVLIPVTTSGAPVDATGTLVDSPGYHVVVPSCTAEAGSACDLVVAFDPPRVGSWQGTLSVTAPGGPYTVRLNGVSGHGYWEAAANGAVFSFGGCGWLGDASHADLAAPIVGMAPTPDHRGYWLVAADGGVFSYGDARFYGSTGRVRLHAPIVGIAATADGHGYWLVAADGGVFSFGDAAFHGSTGNIALAARIVGMARTPDSDGYWLAGADGGVFSFGDAAFHGSTGGDHLVAPVVGITADPYGSGYWETARDGGQFAFDVPFFGSAASEGPAAAVVGAAAS